MNVQRAERAIQVISAAAGTVLLVAFLYVLTAQASMVLPFFTMCGPV